MSPAAVKVWLKSHSAWAGAVGLAGLALYQASAGNWPAAGAAVINALVALGVHVNLPGARNTPPACGTPPPGVP